LPDPQTTTGGKAALLVIDMINDFDFDHADHLIHWLDGVADAIDRLREQARAADVPLIFINDNYDQWHSDRERLIDDIAERSRRRELVDRLRPREDDYFVIKPRFSGFYATTLPVLLPRLEVTRLVLTGVATDVCVLFTAGDAYMRDYGLWVPSDGTACHNDQRRDWALDNFKNNMHAETRATADLSLREWLEVA